MIEQNPAQNIQQEVDTMTYIIHWKMRNWKTLLGIIMSLDFYPRIYSNVNIYMEGKSIVNLVNDYSSLKKIRFSYTPWVLIIDEAGLNANSKDTFSKDNRLLQEILFLIGKKNLSVIWIAQRFESIDVNARVLADGIFKMKKISRYWNHPIFICTKQKQKGLQLESEKITEIDSIQILKNLSITYNQLEESKLEKTKTKEKKEKENNKI